MTIAELKEKIKDLPDEMPVLVREDEFRLYIYGKNFLYTFEEPYISVDANRGLLIT